MIEFKDVNKYYKQKDGELHALKDINLRIDPGEIFGCIGFSGAGKSTLLRCVNGLEPITSGSVIVDQVDFHTLSAVEQREVQKDIGIIFQQFNLLNQKTIYDNIKIVLDISNYPKSEVDARIREVLDFVGLSDKLNEYPNQLSGGQKQRVGIARAIANKPKILLCDEPTSALDPITTDSILELIKKVNSELGITILIITHEMEVISKICNRVAIMESGAIIESGPIFDIFVNPQRPITKKLVNNVINNELPQVVIDQVSFDKATNIRQLIYNTDELSKPLISYLSRNFDVEVSILFGSVIEFQGKLLGSLIVEFICTPEVLKSIYLELEQHNLIVREVEL
ncbi:ATP-binding cassette domain-containing protein [Mollicutes bacterium LVI A0039]|nr:ATP-binding cassette domain-containing protein [Mollicutes bacterium LVI A0039]